MSGCEKIIIDNISEDNWNILLNKVQSEYNVAISGTEGSASKYGYTISWSLNKSANQLTVQCLTKPDSINCGTVNRDISNYLKNAVNAIR